MPGASRAGFFLPVFLGAMPDRATVLFRRLTGVCLLMLLVGPARPAHAQQPATGTSMPAPEGRCGLQIDFNDLHRRLPAPAPVAGKVAGATINVTFSTSGTGDEAWPQAAQDAFTYAVGLWEPAIASAVPIEIEAHWTDRGGCSGSRFTLGSAGARKIWRGFTGAPVADTWYADALADALFGSDIATAVSDPGPDIIARFNKACDDPGIDRWYFGTDGNTPAGQLDFVSVVLHEIGHGLGFTGSARMDDGAGTAECGGTAGHGCLLNDGFPYAYDRLVEEGNGVDLLTYTNNSAALGTALLGGSTPEGGLFFDAPAANAANGNARVRLYTPDPWEGGSSYAHLDEATFNGTTQALMTPTMNTAEAVHQIGAVTCGMFADMGWTISAANCNVVLPVELVAFDARADGDRARLAWTTASETNNAGFQVETRRGAAPWEPLGFVTGRGTTTEAQAYSYEVAGLTPGRYLFRLRQVDFDGAFAYSPEVEVTVSVPGDYFLGAAYPNPFNPQTTFEVAVAHGQAVTVAVYDLLGRRVTQLFDGRLEAGAAQRFTFEARDLPNGLYLIRVQGETFQAARTVTLVK